MFLKIPGIISSSSSLILPLSSEVFCTFLFLLCSLFVFQFRQFLLICLQIYSFSPSCVLSLLINLSKKLFISFTVIFIYIYILPAEITHLSLHTVLFFH